MQHMNLRLTPEGPKMINIVLTLIGLVLLKGLFLMLFAGSAAGLFQYLNRMTEIPSTLMSVTSTAHITEREV